MANGVITGPFIVIESGGWRMGGDVRVVVEDGVGGAEISWLDIGVVAFSAQSRAAALLLPRGVIDLAGVLEAEIGSVGDGR